MDLTRDDLEPASKHLKDLGGTAPAELFAAVLALADPSEVVASLCSQQEVDGRTEWHTVWLTETRLIGCSVAADRSGWDYGSQLVNERVAVDSWTVPLSAVESLGVSAVRTHTVYGSGWGADFVYAVQIATRAEPILIPLLGDFPRSHDRAACVAFVDELRQRMP